MLTIVPSPECRVAFGPTATGSPDAPFIRVRASGRLSATDYDWFEPEFAAELRKRKVPRPSLLLDIRDFRGWTPAGFIRDLRWDFANRRTFSRIAVIGDRPWHRWITLGGRPLFAAPMHYFTSPEAAVAWLG
jgi:hypothetical protein